MSSSAKKSGTQHCGGVGLPTPTPRRPCLRRWRVLDARNSVSRIIGLRSSSRALISGAGSAAA